MCLHPLMPLLGRRIDDPQVIAFLREIGMDPSCEDFEDDYYYIYKSLGLCLLFEEDCLVQIFLHAQGIDGYDQYLGPLPCDLTFSLTRREVKAKLGHPVESGGGWYDRLLDRVIPCWDNYELPGCQMNVSYSLRNNRIEMIALGPLEIRESPS